MVGFWFEQNSNDIIITNKEYIIAWETMVTGKLNTANYLLQPTAL